MPHKIIILPDGTNLVLGHEPGEEEGGNRLATTTPAFTGTWKQVSAIDHPPAQIIIENLGDEKMQDVMKAIGKALKK